ncbi:hypothetical protein LDL36_15090 [Komagataeibacter sp. FNDCR1]|nr:hypothetical protein [Komagataeibacter sp. FNDCR1]
MGTPPLPEWENDAQPCPSRRRAARQRTPIVPGARLHGGLWVSGMLLGASP